MIVSETRTETGRRRASLAILPILVFLTGAGLLRLRDPRSSSLAIAELGACSAALVFVLEWGRPRRDAGLESASSGLADLQSLPRITVVVVGVVFGAALVVWVFLRPPLSNPLRWKLDEAWESGDTLRIAGFFRPAERSAVVARLGAVAEHRGWEAGWPELAGGMTLDEDSRSREEFFLAKGGHGVLGRSGPPETTLAATWVPEGNRWILESLEIPPPPLDEDAQAFVAAWGRGDVEAMAVFAAPEVRAALQPWIGSLLHPARVLGYQTTAGYRDACLRIETEGGAVVARWTLDDRDAWILTGVDRLSS